MSADEKQPGDERLNSAEKQPSDTGPWTRPLGSEGPRLKKRRGLAWHLTRAGAWGIGGALALLLATVAGLSWYTTTGDFQRRVGREIVSVLEDATGGRVELRGVRFRLWRLTIGVDGLTIHGLEGPGEAPYLSAEKVELRVGIGSFFTHATGIGGKSRIGLRVLRVERPRVHLMVDKDGRTNVPVPRHPVASKQPVVDTLLDLRVREVALTDGLVLLNDRAIPFDMAARDVDAEAHYLRATDRYGISMALNDLRTKMGAQPEARSRLKFDAELGRDVVELKGVEFDSGVSSVLHATGMLTHFAQPQWKFAAHGTLELKQVTVLTATDGFTGGTVDVALDGHSCAVAPIGAGTGAARLRSWLGSRFRRLAKPGVGQAPADRECGSGYLIVGSAKLHKAGYEIPNLRLRDVDGAAQMRITPSELLLTEMSGSLPEGGSATGTLRISDWLAPAPTARTSQSAVTSHAHLDATVTRIPLRAIMEATETQGYGDLGFDTAVTGPLVAEWGGPVVNVADTVTVDGRLQLQPTGVQRQGALNNVPMTGDAVAHYDGRREVVNIQHVLLQTPGSTTEAHGVLGVNEGDPLTGLKVDMTVRDLDEFDQLLQTLDFEVNGIKGRAAIPVVLHGGMVFHGTVSGPVADLDAKGHVQGSQVEVKLGTQMDTLLDSVVADAEYSYNEGLIVANSTIERGGAVLNLTGSLRPHKEISRRGVATYLWDEGTSVDATGRLANAQLADLLQMAGQEEKVAVTGKIAASAQVSGTLGDMDGQGRVSLAKGVAYGEPYDSAVAELAVRGQEIDASKVVLLLHGARIAGEGGYDPSTGRLHGHIEGDNLVLSKFRTFAKVSPNTSGTLTVVADANGTMEEPGLKATAKLAEVALEGKPLGDLAAEAHSAGSELFYAVQSKLVGAKIDGAGETQLTGEYETQARVAVSGFDVGTVLALFSPDEVKAQSSIGGVVTVSGPLKRPAALSGAAELNDFDVKLEGVELKAAEPVRVSLKDGIATLDRVHIVGPDTDMQASGTVQAFGSTDPAGGRMNVRASGSVSVALAHTFDPDILSSGRVEFTVAAGGRTGRPSLTGRVKFDNVNASMEGISNGLSSMNGTLVFNEDRLEVENLTAMTGGGQLKIGGFLTYQSGIYADLTATGDMVRVRLNGLSATGNTSLRLQGGPQSLLLSGKVLVTRFGLGPELDFAAFSAAGGVSPPADANAASNKVRLDVHVTSSSELDFQNSYAKLAGTVDLTVRGTVAEPTILGRIEITDGSATFAGTKYELQRGSINFNNPVRIDPTIDMDATARVENYDITVGLQGTMSNLKSTYRSEPPLSEADIFALLALGRTQAEAQLYQEQQMQSGENSTSSALLGGALNETVSNRIGKLFGGGSVKIDPAFVGTLGNSSARITVQQQVTQQLSMTYATNVNYTAQQLIQAQYDLTPNTAIVLTRDESGVYSVVYKIRRRYK